MGRKEAEQIQRDAAREALDRMEKATRPLAGGFQGALIRLDKRTWQARPYECRIESACNAETAEVIALYADMEHRGSRSNAIRDLIARGAASLAAERA